MISHATSSPVDVVVVSYRAADVLDACLASVDRQREPSARIVVVDNTTEPAAAAEVASIVARYPGARLVATGVNLGFGAGANRGMAETTAPAVLFLNPDAVLHPGALSALANALAADPTLAAVTGAVLTPTGDRYPSARRFPDLFTAAGHAVFGLVRPDNRWSSKYLHPEVPDWLSGTAMCVSRAAFETVGGFNEAYFMYVEDVDICWRWRERGFRVGVVEDAVITHSVGSASETAPYAMVLAHHRSLWRFAVSTTTGWKVCRLPLVAVGLAVRTVIAMGFRAIRRQAPAALHGVRALSG
jgi:N-acetylglucosaminyl-diphospho-decaprenol L-rhamnosyltransferase